VTFRTALVQGEFERAADALRGQGRMRLQQGRYEEAQELVELSLEIARRHGCAAAEARGWNVLGIIRYSQKDWSGAQSLYEQALEMALDGGDDELTGLSCLNLGVLANLRGDYHEARRRYLEGIGSFVRSGSTANAMLAYNNLGIASADLHEWMEAEVYFTRGIEIAERLQHAPPTGMLYSNLAEPLIQVGELERARTSLDLAEEAALRVGDRSTLTDVERFGGRAARAAGDPAGARVHLSAALAMAEEHGLEQERAEVCREWAELHLAEGRPDEAGMYLVKAAEIFRTLGMMADAESVRRRIGEVAEISA
jgi:tetratricopeptide (TPR) repeat protein